MAVLRIWLLVALLGAFACLALVGCSSASPNPGSGTPAPTSRGY